MTDGQDKDDEEMAALVGVLMMMAARMDEMEQRIEWIEEAEGRDAENTLPKA
jgi:hypothetical protein